MGVCGPPWPSFGPWKPGPEEAFREEALGIHRSPLDKGTPGESAMSLWVRGSPGVKNRNQAAGQLKVEGGPAFPRSQEAQEVR